VRAGLRGYEKAYAYLGEAIGEGGELWAAAAEAAGGRTAASLAHGGKR
jgi:hypothetical protein